MDCPASAGSMVSIKTPSPLPAGMMPAHRSRAGLQCRKICLGGPWPQSNCIGNASHLDGHLLHSAACPEFRQKMRVIFE